MKYSIWKTKPIHLLLYFLIKHKKAMLLSVKSWLKQYWKFKRSKKMATSAALNDVCTYSGMLSVCLDS